LDRHPGESRGPDVVPAKAGNQFKNWIPVFTGNPGFRLSPECRILRNFDFLRIHQELAKDFSYPNQKEIFSFLSFR